MWTAPCWTLIVGAGLGWAVRIGTAIDLRGVDDSYRIYDRFIAGLAQPRWTFGPYGLLADPANMNLVDTFPFSLITADSYQRLPSAMSLDELAARMYLFSLVLRKFSRRREELRLRDLQARGAREVLDTFMDSLAPKDSFN